MSTKQDVDVTRTLAIIICINIKTIMRKIFILISIVALSFNSILCAQIKTSSAFLKTYDIAKGKEFSADLESRVAFPYWEIKDKEEINTHSDLKPKIKDALLQQIENDHYLVALLQTEWKSNSFPVPLDFVYLDPVELYESTQKYVNSNAQTGAQYAGSGYNLAGLPFMTEYRYVIVFEQIGYDTSDYFLLDNETMLRYSIGSTVAILSSKADKSVSTLVNKLSTLFTLD